MARDPRVRVRLEAEDRSGPVVQRAQGRLARFGNFVRRALVITLADLERVVRGVLGAFGAFITASQQQEDAVRKLDVALAKLGPRAKETSEALQEQAAAIEATTRFSDEAVIASQAFLAQLGVASQQLPEATQATVNLAAALNIELDSAARLVGRTVGGFAGELGEVIPELKELSQEALQAGAGITFLANRFRGTAQADVRTFSGLLAQLSNGMGTLRERVGDALTQNEEFRNGIRRLTQVITSERVINLVTQFAEQVSRLAGFIANVVDNTAAWIETAKDLFGIQSDTNEQLTKQNDELERQNVEIPKSTRNWEENTDAQRDAGQVIESTTTTITDERIEIEVLGREAEQTARAIRQDLIPAQADLRQEVRLSAAEFDALAESAGRAAAVQAAVAAGGQVTSGGRRVQLAGGGSRLTSEAGTTGFAFSSGRFVFVNGRRARVLPDGRVEFL